MSTQNVHTLLYNAHRTPIVRILPEFIQLLDDDIVSLTTLMLITNNGCYHDSDNTNISQLTLSLYLMTQCQLNLHHSVRSLAQTLDYIEVAQRRHSGTLDQLILKLIERKVVACVN